MKTDYRLVWLVSFLLFALPQTSHGQQPTSQPEAIYYHGISGHFDENQTYANAGLIVDNVNTDSPFQKMESVETGRIRSLRVGERISSLGDGGITSARDFNQQINDSRHRHGRMFVSVHANGSDTDGKMFLVQAQPLKQNNFRLGITAAPGPNGGSRVVEVPAGSPATKMWSPLHKKNFTLEAGDEIMSVNGVASPSSDAVIRGLAKTKNGVATLRVLNKNTGGVETFFVDPGRVNAGRKIHYVIVGQTNDRSIGKLASHNLEHLDMLTRHIRSELIGSSQILAGERCEANAIKSAISAIDAKPNDSIFVYYIGHGAHDSNGHRFTLDGTDLYRKEVRKILAGKNVRLSVFLSESCNGYSPPSAEDLAHPASSNGFTISGLTKLESLFLNNRGVIELNSADTGQLGWGDGTIGGIFTFQFAKYMTSKTDSPNSWEEAINEIANRSNEYYQDMRADELKLGDPDEDMRNQVEMTPKLFQFNVQSSPSGIQVGTREFIGVEPVEIDE